jgi:hypothetical protein
LRKTKVEAEKKEIVTDEEAETTTAAAAAELILKNTRMAMRILHVLQTTSAPNESQFVVILPRMGNVVSEIIVDFLMRQKL